jgi:hypothetical protein
MPGIVLMDHGARVDLITYDIDRGGANNLISPMNTTSKNCCGQATSGYLVEVEKLDPNQMEEWRKTFPKAFTKEYDSGSGLHVNAWIEGGND